jgi:hypothetical protein
LVGTIAGGSDEIQRDIIAARGLVDEPSRRGDDVRLRRAESGSHGATPDAETSVYSCNLIGHIEE